MAEAFIFIKTEFLREEETLKAVRKIDGVEEDYNVLGKYDIVTKVSTPSREELENGVWTDIRKLDYVKYTLTMRIIE